MLHTLRRTILACLVVAALALPLALAGCEKDEIHTSREVEIKGAVVSQDTVVE